MISSGVFVGLAILGFLTTAFSAVASKVLHGFSRHELEEYCRRRQRMSLFDDVLDRDEDTLPGVEAVHVVGTVIMLLGAIGWLEMHDSLFNVGAFIAFSVGSVAVLLFTNVLLPWPIVELWSAPFLYHTWRIWRIAAVAFHPIAVSVRAVESVGRKLAGRVDTPESEEEAFEDEIRTIVAEGMKEGHLEEDARDMIEGVIDLSDADVADIMTPRSDIQALQFEMGLEEMLEFVSKVRRTRIPVFRKNIDDIVGILYAKDLLQLLSEKKDHHETDWRKLLRKAWFVPRTQPVDDLLQDFLRTHNHMAIVIDEYTATAGLVTIEDVLEEIVGEIIDESDSVPVDDLRELEDGSLEAHARTHLDKLNELRALDLPENEEFDTIGGLVVSQLGHIPKPGEKVLYENVLVTVLSANQRNVEWVRLEIVEGNDKSAEL